MTTQRSLALFSDLASSDAPANILAAARTLAIQLARSRPLDRRLVAEVMTTAFGASDAEGGWTWRNAYDAIEAATVLQVRRLAPQVARLEDAPAGIAALLAGVSALGLTHSRRSEEQIALDQFSTPPELAALAVLAAQVRPGDLVLEPSAGTGLLAVVAEACGARLTLNEIAPTRAALLDGLFPGATRRRHDGRHLPDLLADAGLFDVAVCNPPFSDLQAHLVAALKTLADGGRLSAIVPLTAIDLNVFSSPIIAAADKKSVGSSATAKDVGAPNVIDTVVTRSAIDHIIPCAATKPVIAVAPINDVVAATAVDGVVAIQTINDIVVGCP
jgi:hypothetical protein